MDWQGSHHQITIEANNARWLERQASAMRKWVPIPELAEHDHTDNRAGVSATRPAL